MEAARQFFYAFLTIHAVAGDVPAVYRLLNSASLFWNTVLGGLQTSTFVTIGRIFDQSSLHNVDRLFKIAQTNPAIFSTAALGRRKQGTRSSAPSWLSDYLKNAHVPTAGDFRHLRTYLSKNRKYMRQTIGIFGVATMRIRSWRIVKPFPLSLRKRKSASFSSFWQHYRRSHDSLWELFHNGRKPVLTREAATDNWRREPIFPMGWSSQRWFLTTLLLALLGSPAIALEKYLCIADASTGFKWDGSKWVIAKFKADEKYVVREVEEYDFIDGKVNYEVTELGGKYPKHRCFRDAPEQKSQPPGIPNVGDRMPCGALGSGFLMAFDTLRYQEYWGHGYVGNDLGSTPNITIGKCSRLE